jgi:NADH-quinone oxidoreductase subunit A
MAVYIGLVLLLTIGMIGLSALLGERRRQRLTGVPYESGVPITGGARVRQMARYYVVALLFVVFDLEAAFIIAWVIAFRELGWAGYVEIVVFIGVLLAGYVYLWRRGAFDWGTRTNHADDGAAGSPDNTKGGETP